MMRVCACRLDLSSLLQGRLQSLSSTTADSDANRPSCMVSTHVVTVSRISHTFEHLHAVIIGSVSCGV